MILRSARESVLDALRRQAAVALLGPRQVGKTTLALELARDVPSVYLDLEDPSDRSKLTDARLYLEAHADKLVILDEVHRVPDLFAVLRGVIDRGRREGRGVGRFLVLGSASMDLLEQSSESLAGRIAFVELAPLLPSELEGGHEALDRLWSRGGFPGSFLAGSDAESSDWRTDFIRTYLERDVPMFGPRVPGEALRRLWIMLAHHQGGLLNASDLARNLGVSSQTIARYIDLLVGLLLVRRLPAFHMNAGKRLVKSPKVYIRDSGLAHALLNVRTIDELLGHPVVGGSWEGFVIEALLASAPAQARGSFYRSSKGAEVDLLLEMPRGERWAIEIKRSTSPSLTRGSIEAIDDLCPTRTVLVYPGTERYPLREGVEAMGLRDAIDLLNTGARRDDDDQLQQ